MQYTLNIDIDDTGLQHIYAANQSVTIVKSVVSGQPSDLPVAWLAFQPLETNQVSWIENYFIYATTTVLKSGATIVMTSQTGTPVQVGWTYTFAQGQFTGASGTGDTYNVSDQMQGQYNFGLAQAATINNVTTVAPLNAVPVLFNENASFTPQETISIFLSSYDDNGTVISQVASNALTVPLSSQNPTANIGFDDATNAFYLMSNQAAFAKRFRSLKRSA